jgi:hypothetical protein
MFPETKLSECCYADLEFSASSVPLPIWSTPRVESPLVLALCINECDDFNSLRWVSLMMRCR